MKIKAKLLQNEESFNIEIMAFLMFSIVAFAMSREFVLSVCIGMMVMSIGILAQSLFKYFKEVLS